MVGVEAKSIISAPTSVLWQIMMEVGKYPQWYSVMLEAGASARSQIEVSREGDGRVNEGGRLQWAVRLRPRCGAADESPWDGCGRCPRVVPNGQSRG